MDSSFSSISGGATGITFLSSDVISSHILTKLDGPTLASTGCSSPQLHTLCSDQNLWKVICNSSFPSTVDPLVHNLISSFSSEHQSFYSDTFPILHHHQERSESKIKKRGTEERSESKIKKKGTEETSELISAVDVQLNDYSAYSKVVVTKSRTDWFTSSPLRIDLVEPKDSFPIPVKSVGDENQLLKKLEEEMKLSWIIIDPTRKRAINLSSQSPVTVRRHWYTEHITVRYATVMEAAGVEGGYVSYVVTVTCGGKDGGELHVREISMQVENIEGKIISGKDSLVILHNAMEGKRVKLEKSEKKKRYENFLEMRRMWREHKHNRDKRIDLVCMAIGVTNFIAFLALFLFK